MKRVSVSSSERGSSSVKGSSSEGGVPPATKNITAYLLNQKQIKSHPTRERLQTQFSGERRSLK
jgi:hypothetical protein